MHVLVSIGDAAARDAVRDALTTAGHEVTAVADARAAGAALDGARPALCLVESSLDALARVALPRDDAATLQHEINNPLAALLAHAALIEQGLHEPGEERDLLAVIVEQAHRIAAAVRRFAAQRHPHPDDSEFVPDDD
jgi:signal transduction histidine kinase